MESMSTGLRVHGLSFQQQLCYFSADMALGKLLSALSLRFPAVRNEHHPPSPAFPGSSVRLAAWQGTALSLES